MTSTRFFGEVSKQWYFFVVFLFELMMLRFQRNVDDNEEEEEEQRKKNKKQKEKGRERDRHNKNRVL